MGRGCGSGPISREERLAFKTTRITSRISALETALLDPSLPSDQKRATTWRLEHLKSKLERINTIKGTLAGELQGEKTEEPWRHWRRGPGCGPRSDGDIGQVPCGDAPAWGHCGRGWGGKCRRARLDVQRTTAGTEGDHAQGKTWVVPKEAWARFHESKENLKAARRSGDAEAIKVAYEGFLLAKKEKQEARYHKA